MSLNTPFAPARQDGSMKRLALTLLGLISLTLARAAPTEPALQRVPVQRVLRPGLSVAGTPANLNVSITLRYGSKTPGTVLLLMPGYLGGAGSFDRLARQIVALDPKVAVWAVDRRSNLLEPQNRVRFASRAQLETLAREGLPVLPAEKVAYMKDWGLNVTLNDWRAAVQEARKLTPRVFIGGHSLGAALSGLYAAYDFGGQRGYNDVRGLVMLDGYPGLLSGNAVSPQEYQQGANNMIGPIPGTDNLASAPYVNTFFYGPQLASRAAAQARLAAQYPQAPAPPDAFLKWPATNLAAAMTTISQRYTFVPFLALTTGRATNVRETPNPLPRFLGGQDSQRIEGPQDPEKLIGWQGDAQSLTDAQDFARRFWLPLSDATEWYFPQKLALDVAAARLSTTGTPYEQTLPVLYNAAVTLPLLGISAQNGVTTDQDFQQYAEGHIKDLTLHTLPGAAHLDMTYAKSDQVARWITEWLAKHP
ncbi:alpha/beta fold hydrolase [Deinococcus cavernae]|uniref:Alpha/beta fold hydrolase n=2 Tax=Deinococcus cavernae TaxID=2320857 RepID=A0A418VB53_9DEIO|nr:alpha/beta fold hydrolase [Deinococcus cavernae]